MPVTESALRKCLPGHFQLDLETHFFVHFFVPAQETTDSSLHPENPAGDSWKGVIWGPTFSDVVNKVRVWPHAPGNLNVFDTSITLAGPNPFYVRGSGPRRESIDVAIDAQCAPRCALVLSPVLFSSEEYAFAYHCGTLCSL